MLGGGRGTVFLPQRGGLCRTCLHCSLLQGKEADEEGVVKETKSEGEEGPSRGETTEQVSTSLPCLGAFFLWGQGPSSAAARPSGWHPWGGDGAPLELPLGWKDPWRGQALPSCLLADRGPSLPSPAVESTMLSFLGVFPLTGEDPGGIALGFAFLQSREMGAWGSCCPRAPSLEMCVGAWVEHSRALLLAGDHRRVPPP